jgi:hypothetical protein
MTTADLKGDRQLRSQRQLLRLRMLVLSQDGMAPARQAAEIRDATNAVIAEVEATSRAVLEAGGHAPGAETFLWVRVTRLATSAMWTVQHAVYGQEPTTRR